MCIDSKQNTFGGTTVLHPNKSEHIFITLLLEFKAKPMNGGTTVLYPNKCVNNTKMSITGIYGHCLCNLYLSGYKVFGIHL